MMKFDREAFEEELDKIHDTAIEDYLDEYCDEDNFCEYLNEEYQEAIVCGITFEAGDVLREMDPIAFRCAFNDYQDSMREEAEANIVREDLEEEAYNNLDMEREDD